MALRTKTTLGGSIQKRGSFLATARCEFEQRHRFMVVAGPSGIGKTEFCLQFPKPLLVINDYNERGTEDLAQKGELPADVYVGDPIEDWRHLMETTGEIIENPDHGYATILVEAITGLEQMAWDYSLLVDDWKDRADFMAFSKGPKTVAKSHWRHGLLRNLARIRQNGCHMLLTAHSRVKQKENPEGDDYSGEVTYCDSETWQQTHGVAEAVGVMIMQTVQKQNNKGALKKKVETEGNRQLYLHKTSLYDAKNRWHIDAPINFPSEGGARAAYLETAKRIRMNPETGFFE